MDPNDEIEDLHDEEIEGTEGTDEGQDDDAPGSDEGQADGEEGAEAEVREEPRQVSRGERRFQKLSNDLSESRQRMQQMERELQEVRAERSRQQAQQQEKEPTPEEMALWSVDQQVQYRLDKGMRGMNQTLQQVQFQSADMADRTAFQALCGQDPRAAKYAKEVEDRLTGLRAQGQNVPREALLRYIIGEKVLTGGPKAAATQRQQGQARIARQRGAQAAPRSDNAGGRQAKTDAEKRRERLENVVF